MNVTFKYFVLLFCHFIILPRREFVIQLITGNFTYNLIIKIVYKYIHTWNFSVNWLISWILIELTKIMQIEYINLDIYSLGYILVHRKWKSNKERSLQWLAVFLMTRFH